MLDVEEAVQWRPCCVAGGDARERFRACAGQASHRQVGAEFVGFLRDRRRGAVGIFKRKASISRSRASAMRRCSRR